MAAIDRDSLPKIANDVAWVEVEGEIVTVDPEGAQVHLLDGVGAVIWQLLDGSASVEVLAQELADAFSSPIETVHADVAAFLERMIGLGLVTSDGTVGS